MFQRELSWIIREYVLDFYLIEHIGLIPLNMRNVHIAM